jgi:cyclopropane fatty-acyl-phospholipid synthase-like methyltransferase
MQDARNKINQLSNTDHNWSKLYDFYEIEMREVYKTISKPQNESHFEMLRTRASKYLSNDKIFCEIGFSAGLTLRLVSPYFKKVYGLDISPKNIEFTKHELNEEGYTDIELYTSDLMKFDSRFIQKFDVISFIHGLEHFSQDDYPIILSNIKEYLLPNGIFTGALPYKNRFNYRMCPNCNTVFEIDGHVSSHDENSLKQIFEKNGFKTLFIDHFNLRYALKKGSFIKRLFKFAYYLLKYRPVSQIEFIATPK